jgi:6-carboxyhexanoate--CoA ligase
MRAEKDSLHTSGAERIVEQEEVATVIQSLFSRSLEHSNGEPDSVTLTCRKLARAPVFIPALPVQEINLPDSLAARGFLAGILTSLELSPQPILDLFYSLQGMRGAVLLDVDRRQRLEPDQERGVRASNLDYAGEHGEQKNHFREALCLASKVAASPFIIGEICRSDDQDYTTGYFASRDRGYLRLSNLKDRGDRSGGRIFLFRGDPADVPACLDYLENQPVIVTPAAGDK